MTSQNFDEAIKNYNKAMTDFFKGNAEAIINCYSNSDEISLAQLSGPFVLGRKQVAETARHNATKYQESNGTTFKTLAKHVADEFAYIVQIEKTSAKINGSNRVTNIALRVTSIFQIEDCFWKLLHRHVDSNVPDDC
jgi:ketosteroid isomerase-like protein